MYNVHCSAVTPLGAAGKFTTAYCHNSLVFCTTEITKRNLFIFDAVTRKAMAHF